MKKIAQLLSLTLVLMLAFSLTACGKKSLTIWVGTESQQFYQQMVDDYVENYNTTHEENFPSKIVVQGVDSGAAAAQFLDDTEAGPDIFTIPHDNLGKLTAGSSSIAAITNQTLIAQMEADNPQTFLDVSKSTVDGTTYYFAVPYVSQSLVLYYNSSVLTAQDVETWEGISAKAAAYTSTIGHDVKASTILATDGYNNSFLLLSEYYNSSNELTTSVQLYENGVASACYATGDDTIAAMKWGRRYFQMTSGGIDKGGSSGWEEELKDEYSLCLIGGAWNYNAALAALGNNLGIAVLPEFTITDADAYGTITAGTVYQSGTFTDCKCFVMKKGSNYQAYLEDILIYLSSVSVQEESFETCANLPAYKNAADEFAAMNADTLAAKLASCEIEMFNYGIAQPFGYVQKYNTWYYSKGTPDLIYAMLKNTDNAYPDDASILNCLQTCETIWKTGAQN